MDELPLRVKLPRQTRRSKSVFISGTAGPMQPYRDQAKVILHRDASIQGVLNSEDPAFSAGVKGHTHDICLEKVKRCTDLLLIVGHEAGDIYAGRSWSYRRQRITITHAEVRKARKTGKILHCFVMGDVWVAYKIWCDNARIRKKMNWGDFDKRVFELLRDLFSKGEVWRIKFDDIIDFERKVRDRFQAI